MDALFHTYPHSDDDDDEHRAPSPKRHKRHCIPPAPSHTLPSPWLPTLPTQAHAPPHAPSAAAGLSVLGHGRYVSKRERAVMGMATHAASLLPTGTAIAPHPPLHPPPPKPELPTVLNSKLPHRIQSKLDRAMENAGARNRCPQEHAMKLEGHSKAVVAVRWSPTHGALLASGGMDGKAYIWNAWESPDSQMAHCLSCHTHALKDVQWALDGTSLLSCGFDQTARLSDVETGTQTQVSF